MQFQEIIILIWRNKIKLAVFALISAAAVFLATIGLKREYASNAEIYTGISSGLSLMNTENQRLDFYAIQVQFENLLNAITSKQTLKEVSLHLLAQHMLLKEPDPMKVSAATLSDCRSLLPDTFAQRMTAGKTHESTVENLYREIETNIKSPLHPILESSNSIYAISRIRKSVIVKQKETSDIVDLGCITTDPGVSYHTLIYLIKVYSEQYKSNRISQSQDVVAYFEAELLKAQDNLQASEYKLETFRKQNSIINYYEQTKFVAESKEESQTNLDKFKQNLAGSKKATLNIENQLSSMTEYLQRNEEVIDLKDSLRSIYIQQSNAYLANNTSLAESLANRISEINLELEEMVRFVYASMYSVRNISNSRLLQVWLDESVKTSELEAKINVLSSRIRAFDGEFAAMAPLGSKEKSFERETDIAEKAYLEILHSLNLAQLRKQNLNVTNNIEVQSSPVFPFESLPTKRKLLIILGGIVAICIGLALIIGKRLLNSSLLNKSNAERVTQLQVITALPDFTKLGKEFKSNTLLPILFQKILGYIDVAVQTNFPNFEGKKLIIIGSSSEQEGKTFFCQHLAEKIAERGQKVLIVSNGEIESNEYDTDFVIRQTSKLCHSTPERYQKELKKFIDDCHDCEYVFIELPALSNPNIPVQILTQAHLLLFIANASKVWSESDNAIIRNVTNFLEHSPKLMLNKLDMMFLSEIFGELPRKQSLIERISTKVQRM